MTASYGGLKYQSPTQRALASITESSYEKVFDDQGQLTAKLVNDVSYMAQNMRKMQSQVDQADENVLQQLRDFVNDIIVVMGGQGDTGFDFGDLKYVIAAISSLFGFTDDNGNIQLPINLFTAAENFINNYIFAGGNFQDMVDNFVDEALATMLDVFGEVPIANQEVEQVAVFISSIRDDLDPLIAAFTTLIDSIGLDMGDLSSISGFFGSFSTLWASLSNLFAGVNFTDFGPVFQIITEWDAQYLNEIAAVIDAMTTYVNFMNDAVSVYHQTFTFANLGSAFTSLFSLFGLQGITLESFDPMIWATDFINNLLSPTGLLGGLGFGDIAQTLFGVTGGNESVLNTIGTNLMDLLGNPVLDAANFDPISSAQTFLQDVLTPAGALTTATQIPIHLLSSLFPGNTTNLLQSAGGSFDDPSAFDGATVWSWDGAIDHTGKTGSGSAKTVAANILRQLIGVPIEQVAPGQNLTVSAYVQWSGVSATGQSFVLAVNSYDVNDNPITNPSSVVASVSNPATAGSWQQMSGTFTVPANTSYVRLCLQVNASVALGTIWFDDCSMMVQGGLFDAGLLANIENIPQILMDSVENLPGLNTAFSQLGQIFNGEAVTPITEEVANILDWFTGNTSNIGGLQTSFTKLGQIFNGLNPSGLSSDLALIESWFTGNTSLVSNNTSNIFTNAGNITTLQGWFSKLGQIFNGLSPTGLSSDLALIESWFTGNTSSLGTLNTGQSSLSSMINQIGQVFNAQSVTPINTAIQQIQDWWSSVLGPNTMASNHQALVDAVQIGATGSGGTGALVADAQSAVSGIRNALAGVGAQVSSIVTQLSGTGGGNLFTGQPANQISNNWGSDWTLSGNGSVGIDSSNSFAWVDSGGSPRTEIGIKNTGVTQTDYQALHLVFNSRMETPLVGTGANCGNGIIGRCDSPTNPQNYVYARIYYNQVVLGCVVAGANHVWATASLPAVYTGMSYELDCGTAAGANVFTFLAGGNPIVSYTDSAGQSRVGAAYRYGGQAMYSDSRYGGGESTPGSIKYWSLADNSPSALLGTGFIVAKTTTTGVTILASSNNFPANFFNTVVKATSDISWDAATNTATINTPGWYQFIENINFLSSTGTIQTVTDTGGILFQNGGATQATPQITGSSATGILGTFMVYCNAGDTITPGYVSATNVTIYNNNALPTAYIVFCGVKVSP